MVKTWMADILFPYLQNFYSEAEAFTGLSFFHPMPLYRPFISAEEQNEWMARSAEAAFTPYIDRVLTKSTFEAVNDPFGGLLLKQCGYYLQIDAAAGDLAFRSSRSGLMLHRE